MRAQPEMVKRAFLRSEDEEIEEVMTTIFFFSSISLSILESLLRKCWLRYFFRNTFFLFFLHIEKIVRGLEIFSNDSYCILKRCARGLEIFSNDFFADGKKKP